MAFLFHPGERVVQQLRPRHTITERATDRAGSGRSRHSSRYRIERCRPGSQTGADASRNRPQHGNAGESEAGHSLSNGFAGSIQLPGFAKFLHARVALFLSRASFRHPAGCDRSRFYRVDPGIGLCERAFEPRNQLIARAFP